MSNNSKSNYSQLLKQLRNDLSQILPEESLNVFDDDALQLGDFIKQILQVDKGDKAPDFTLSNVGGRNIRLYEVLKESRVILVFYRGTWCPYCNLILSHYQSYLSQFKERGATLIAISPQTPDQSLSIQEKNNLEFEVLSDNGNLVAQLYTHVFRNGDKPLVEMAKLGYNFDSFYGNDLKEIPVPAVFIIEKDGTISFAESEGGDYRKRTDASVLLSHLSK